MNASVSAASAPAGGTEQVDEELRLRRELAAAYRAFAHWGWDDLIFTHLSVRVPGPEHHFLLNPYDLRFDEITASSLIKVGLDGAAVEPTEHMTNPAGFVIHSALHAAREDAKCVMHLHTIAGQAVSAQEQGLLPTCQTAMIAMMGGVAYHGYEGLATEAEERARLVADLGARSVMILRNHGLLTLGETVGDALLRMYFLERACQVQIQASAGGARLVPPPEGTPEKTAAQAAAAMAPVARHLAWPAVYRKMVALYPELES